MEKRAGYIFLFTLVVGYTIFQFLWWEVLLVRQTIEVHEEKQKILELSILNPTVLQQDIATLHHEKNMRIYMIVGEGTVFLLMLLYGIYRVRKGLEKETEVSRQQHNFLLSVTHELKTPIAAAKLQLQTMQKHDLEKDKQQQLLGSALQETERLQRLVETLLLATRLETNDFILHKEETAVPELVLRILNTYFKPYLQTGALSLHLGPDFNFAIDPFHFQSIVINLVENAIKYSFDHIEVQVSLHAYPGGFRLSVSDEGIGIEDKEKRRIFDKFYRSGNEDTRNTKGTGLGLYITKKLVQQHKGNIQVHNNTPKGTVITLDFTA